jgi:excinuclease ABC subunit C
MMFEILKRRFSRGVESGDLPDLVVVDGGKGQLGVALAVMKELGVEDLDVIALAKMKVQSSPRSSEVERTEDRVFLPGQSNPVLLRRNSNALFLLQRVRDEAHRFAITYHKKLRGKQTF